MQTVTSTQTDGRSGRNEELSVTIHSDPRYRGNIAELRTHPFYLKLAPTQRRYLESYLSLRDVTKAAHAAAKYKSDFVAKMAGSRYMRDYRITYLISEYDGHPLTEATAPITPRELEFLIAQRLRSGIDMTDSVFLSLCDRLMTLKRWDKGAKAPGRKRKPVDPVPDDDSGLSDPFERVRLLEAQRSNE